MIYPVIFLLLILRRSAAESEDKRTSSGSFAPTSSPLHILSGQDRWESSASWPTEWREEWPTRYSLSQIGAPNDAGRPRPQQKVFNSAPFPSYGSKNYASGLYDRNYGHGYGYFRDIFPSYGYNGNYGFYGQRVSSSGNNRRPGYMYEYPQQFDNYGPSKQWDHRYYK